MDTIKAFLLLLCVFCHTAFGTFPGSFPSTISTATTFSDGTETLPGMAFTEETGSGFYRIGANNVGFSLGGTQYIDISPSTFGLLNGFAIDKDSFNIDIAAGASNGDITVWDENSPPADQFGPAWRGGSSATEQGYIQTVFFGATDAIDSLDIGTFTDNGSTDRGKIRFLVDQLVTMEIVDNGANVERNAPALNVQFLSSNTATSSATAHARVVSRTTPTGGDPLFILDVNTAQQYYFGIDNSNSDVLNLGEGTTVGGARWGEVSAAGNSVRLGVDAEYTAVELESAGSDRFRANATGIGFFAATPVAQAAAFTQTYSTADRTHANPTGVVLTDSSGGTPDQTVSAVTDNAETTNNSTINDNFAEMADEINKLVADMADIKQLVNSVIDDMQAYGLAQ